MKNYSWKVNDPTPRVTLPLRRIVPRRCAPAAYVGKAYAAEPDALKRELEAFFTSKEGPDWKPSSHASQSLKGIIAPHYDLRQGGPIYAWAWEKYRKPRFPMCSSSSVRAKRAWNMAMP